jgi:hypothetical protein
VIVGLRQRTECDCEALAGEKRRHTARAASRRDNVNGRDRISLDHLSEISDAEQEI